MNGNLFFKNEVCEKIREVICYYNKAAQFDDDHIYKDFEVSVTDSGTIIVKSIITTNDGKNPRKIKCKLT